MKLPIYSLILIIIAVYMFVKNVLVLSDSSSRTTNELTIPELSEGNDDYTSMLTQTASLFGVEYIQNDESEPEDTDSFMLENVRVQIQVVRSVNERIEAVIIGTSTSNEAETHIIEQGDQVFGYTIELMTPRQIVFSKDAEKEVIQVFKPQRLNETEEQGND